jgi:predicted RNA-binding protein Jag
MSAYERRVIHAELALRPDINTESEGEPPSRCVVVKPL